MKKQSASTRRSGSLWALAAGRGAVVAGLLGAAAAGCSGGNPGGANRGERAPGSGPSGVAVSRGEIAVHPSGRFFLSEWRGGLAMGDLGAGTSRSFDELPTPTALAFWDAAAGDGFYLVSSSCVGRVSPEHCDDKLASFSLAEGRILWERPLERRYTRLQVAKGGERLVLAERDVLVLDAKTGATVASITAPGSLVDVDLSPDGARAILTSDRQTPAAPTSLVQVHDLARGEPVCEIVVPNCADNLVVAQGGSRAFLAPTRCRRDPVSVIELDACRFRENLPGFGPVALAAGGETAVAFIDTQIVDPGAPPLPPEVRESEIPYHLMFINVNTLAYTTAPVGNQLPRYAVTPDGGLLLVDSDDWGPTEVRVLDVAKKAMTRVDGPGIELEEYVLTPDSKAAFALYNGLFHLDLRAARNEALPLPFAPEGINITPDGSSLLLRTDDGAVYRWGVATARVEPGVFFGPAGAR
jgi:hypothetical protein